MNDVNDAISRQQAIETFKDCAVNGVGIDGIVDALEQLPPIQPELQYKTNYGFMWLCPKCGLPIHSDYTRCVRCGHNREKGV